MLRNFETKFYKNKVFGVDVRGDERPGDHQLCKRAQEQPPTNIRIRIRKLLKVSHVFRICLV